MLGDGHEREDLLVRAIGRIGGREATDTLLKYLEKPAIMGTTAREIERILGAGGDPVVLAKVEASLESNSTKKRISMLHVLGAARKPEHAAAIRKLLAGETDSNVKRAAIVALGRIGDPESADVLLKLAQGSDPITANQAVSALHTIRDRETVSSLMKSWDKLDDRARHAVMGAAARVSSRPTKDVVKVARDSLYDSNERVRCDAVLVLARSGNDEHVEAIGAFLRGAKSSRERSRALDALRRMGSAKAAEEALRSIGSLPASQQDSVRARFEKIAEEHARLRKVPGKR